MPEAWELQPDEQRTAELTETFIVFCEDEVNEPIYLQEFQRVGKVKINPVIDQKSSFLNFTNASRYCVNLGLMEFRENIGYTLLPQITEHIWSVYDRDAENENNRALNDHGDLQFTQAIQAAQNAGLNVAWSNDVFELWILLHFEDIVPGVWRHRSYVYDRLTAVLKALPNQPPEMQRVTQNPYFYYKTAMKNRMNFINFVRPLLQPRLNDAIQRARQLEQHYPTNMPFHACNPCTKMHHLIESIQSFY
jgi:hypothetical protein